MIVRRRHVLKAGLAALVLTGVPDRRTSMAASLVRDREAAAVAPRWCMVVDMATLHGKPSLLDAAIAACHAAHNVPDIPQAAARESGHFRSAPVPDRSVAWMRAETPDRAFHGDVPLLPAALSAMALPVLCNHCDNPPCVRVCPTGATFQDAENRVVMDPHRCIGCRYCMAACPYGARSFNFMDPAPYVASPNPDYPLRQRGVVEKCTFCPERTAMGELPWCVEAAPEVFYYGNLRQEDGILQALFRNRPLWRRKPHLGTEPAVYYAL